MIAVRSTLGPRTIRLVVFAAGLSACVMSHPSAREVAHYPAINLAAPLPYNVIAISSLNVTGDMMLLETRDRMEESVATCLNRRGIRTVVNHSAADEDQIRWRPRREPDDSAVIATSKTLAVRGVLVIDVLEMRRTAAATYGPDAMVIDARLVDREAGAVLWARKSGMMAVPGVAQVRLTGATPIPAGSQADQNFTLTVCQLVESLRARGQRGNGRRFFP